MNHEPNFEKRLHKFSVVQKCPRCGHLSLSFREGKIACQECGYEEKIPRVK